MTAAVPLKHRITRWGNADWYALYGPHGVVAWGYTNLHDHWHLYCEVGFHSPRPLHDGHDTSDRCPFLESGCYLDGGHLDLGRDVGLRWAAADWDDQVIWRALGGLYLTRLGGGEVQ